MSPMTREDETMAHTSKTEDATILREHLQWLRKTGHPECATRESILRSLKEPCDNDLHIGLLRRFGLVELDGHAPGSGMACRRTGLGDAVLHHCRSPFLRAMAALDEATP